jgi:hypothetical protein
VVGNFDAQASLLAWCGTCQHHKVRLRRMRGTGVVAFLCSVCLELHAAKLCVFCILHEDPEFLSHVDQMSIETHVSKAWMTTREHLYYFGLHFALLEEAGFHLEWSQVFGCSKRHEDPGCLDEIYGFPCSFKPWPGRPNVVIGWRCQDFLWKRY